MFISFSFLSSAQSDSAWEYIESIEGTDEWVEHIVKEGVGYLQTDIEKLQILAKKGLDHAIENDDDALRGISLNMLGLYLNQTGNPDSSIALHKEALKYLRNTSDLGALARSYSYLSNSHYYAGQIHAQAIYSDSSFIYADSVGDETMLRTLKFNRAFLMSNIGKPKETERMLKELFRELSSDEQIDSSFLGMVALNLGQHYRTNVVDSAIYFTDIAYQIAVDQDIDWMEANALSQLAGYRVYINDYATAKQNLDDAIVFYDELDDPYGLLMVLMNYAKYYMAIENYDLAAYYADSTVNFSTASGYEIWHRDALEIYSAIEENRGNFEESLGLYKAFKAVHDSLESADIKSQVASLEMRFNAAEKEAELAKLRSQKRKQWIVYISGAAILVLLVVIFIGMRNRAIARQKISEKERQRLKAEVSRVELEESNLRKEVSLKNQQLTAKALHLSQRNQLLESLLERIEKTQQEEGDVDRLLPTLVREIKLSLQSDSEWKEFRTYFEELNQDFFDKVKERFPEVTEKELRLLALTKIGLTIKEIAHLMHVEPNSVKTARYRMKKKLELADEASLEEFVDQI